MVPRSQSGLPERARLATALAGLAAATGIAAIATAVAPSAATAATASRRHVPVARCSHTTRTRTRLIRCATHHSTRTRAVSYPARPPQKAPTPTPAQVASCPGMLDTPTATNAAQIEAATLCLVNAVRIHLDVPPLAENARLDAAALAHSRDEVDHNYFDHTSPSGMTQDDLVRLSGYLDGERGWSIGENLAYGSLDLTTPYATVLAWFWSPEHRDTMLSRDYRETGIGVVASAPAVVTNDRPAATYTEEFGTVSQ